MKSTQSINILFFFKHVSRRWRRVFRLYNYFSFVFVSISGRNTCANNLFSLVTYCNTLENICLRTPYILLEHIGETKGSTIHSIIMYYFLLMQADSLESVQRIFVLLQISKVIKNTFDRYFMFTAKNFQLHFTTQDHDIYYCSTFHVTFNKSIDRVVSKSCNLCCNILHTNESLPQAVFLWTLLVFERNNRHLSFFPRGLRFIVGRIFSVLMPLVKYRRGILSHCYIQRHVKRTRTTQES